MNVQLMLTYDIASEMIKYLPVSVCSLMTNENKYAVVDVYILELHLSPPVVGQVCLN